MLFLPDVSRISNLDRTLSCPFQQGSANSIEQTLSAPADRDLNFCQPVFFRVLIPDTVDIALAWFTDDFGVIVLHPLHQSGINLAEAFIAAFKQRAGRFHRRFFAGTGRRRNPASSLQPPDRSRRGCPFPGIRHPVLLRSNIPAVCISDPDTVRQPSLPSPGSRQADHEYAGRATLRAITMHSGNSLTITLIFITLSFAPVVKTRSMRRN